MCLKPVKIHGKRGGKNKCLKAFGVFRPHLLSVVSKDALLALVGFLGLELDGCEEDRFAHEVDQVGDV